MVEACGVGLTVLNCIRGDLGNNPSDLPRTPGHEIVGRIVATGANADPRRLGERIVAYFYLFCGQCRHCIAGEENLCENLSGFLGVNRDGGYAEMVSLPEGNAVPCPDTVDAAAATVIPDAVATPVHVVDRTSIGKGKRVVVIGAGGGVGVHMVQVARLHGADVIGLDLQGPKLDYLDEVLKVPAIDSSDFARTQLPSSWANQADVIIDLVGTAASTEWALSRLSSGGRVALLTTFREAAFNASQRDMVLSELSVVGSRYANRQQVQVAASLVAGGDVQAVVGATATLGEVQGLHEKLLSGTLIGRGAMVAG